MKKLINTLFFTTILISITLSKVSAAGLADLMWNNLKFKCVTKNWKQFNYKTSIEKVVEVEDTYLGVKREYNVININNGIMLATRKEPNVSKFLYLVIDINKSLVRKGFYTLKLNDEKEFTEMSVGKCIKDLN